jgi:glycosyltransferase involved in cell wall biosynthesis
VHGLWLYQSYAVSKALQQYKQKQLNSSAPLLFVMPHGMLDPYFQKASSRKLKAIRNWMYWKLIEAKVVNEADGILFTCKAELELARKSFRPYHPKRKINVGYGILAPPLFKPSMKKAFYENCPDLDQQPFILFLSRIHKKKGIDLLLKAYALLVQKIEKLNKQVESNKNSSKGKAITGSNNRQVPKLVIAGPGLDTHYGVKLQQTVATSKELKETVHFLGMLSGEAKWGAFYACEAFVLPSHQENFGIAVVEALACAKPVLISNQVNIWREIEAAECGLVADDTLKGTVQLLEGWFNLEQEDKGTMSKKALITYEKQFAISTAVESFLNAINLCIEDNNIG